MRILKYDDAILLQQNKALYIDDINNYSSWPYLLGGWTAPFVTGHKYKISWGATGLDWDQAEINLSPRWAENDRNIYMVHNFTETREKMDVSVNDLEITADNFKDGSIDLTNENNWELGNNVLYTSAKEFHFIVNGHQPEEGKITDVR
jgi:hypothetical protein